MDVSVSRISGSLSPIGAQPFVPDVDSAQASRARNQVAKAAPTLPSVKTLATAGLFDSPTSAGQALLKSRMHDNITSVAAAFACQYAPAQIKNDTRNWQLEKAVAAALEKIDVTEGITIKDYHKILRHFFESVGDYHVSVRFHSTESASLPFSVMGAQGRVFLTYVDKERLPGFPFAAGDELVSFNGRPVTEVVDELQKDYGPNVPATDRRLAELALTKRSGQRGDVVPQGKVTIEVKRRGSDKVESFDMKWQYKPEVMGYKAPVTLASFENLDLSSRHDTGGTSWPFLGNMELPSWKTIAPQAEADPTALGGRESYVPELGKVTWRSGANSPFNAYIFKTDDGRKVGYVRIPSYVAGQSEAISFLLLVLRFQLQTDGLVIDEINNPGGSVGYLQTLAGMLSDTPMFVPRHRVAITQGEVDAANALVQTDADRMAANLGVASIPPALLEQLRDQAAFVLDQWRKAQANPPQKEMILTEPYQLGLGNFAEPSLIHYTKPIMVLTNNTDFSGGDFFPAIMQDNKRATILGTRTAGAGGFIHQVDCNPNSLGVNAYSFTGSVAERIDGSKIEGDGVKPDIEYQITADDIQNGYAGYKQAILDGLKKILPPKRSGSSALGGLLSDVEVELAKRGPAFQRSESQIRAFYALMHALTKIVP